MCPPTRMIVAWHIDVCLWRLVLAFQRFPPILVLFGTCEKKILVGGSRRVQSSPRLTLFLAPCKYIYIYIYIYKRKEK